MKTCELCHGEASVYCVSDSAFLCWNCDARVHEVNFLVARHVRCTICRKCKCFDGNRISGVGSRSFRSTCKSCSSSENLINFDSNSDSCSSTCISTAAESVSKKRRTNPAKVVSSSSVSEISEIISDDFGEKNRKRVVLQSRSSAGDILVNWCKKLGLKENSVSIVQLALHAFDVCMQKLTLLPFRVNLASALWFALKFYEANLGSTCRNLRRFEGITGVPGKLILLAEKKASRVLKMSRRDDEVIDLEEGWAECSD